MDLKIVNLFIVGQNHWLKFEFNFETRLIL